MAVRKIREVNGQQFLDDVERVSGIMCYVAKTNTFLTVQKKEVMKEAETEKIKYYITKKIFKVRRDVMVII